MQTISQIATDPQLSIDSSKVKTFRKFQIFNSQFHSMEIVRRFGDSNLLI